MSKTTQRHGQLLFAARLSVDFNVTPSDTLQRTWADLDKAATKAFGKRYDALTDTQKLTLHYDLNVAREKARDERSPKPVSASK